MDEKWDQGYSSFLGTGWSFPPQFLPNTGEVAMGSDRQDVEESLRILLGTAAGERFLRPDYGLDLHEMLFEPMSTTMKTYLKDRIRIGLLIYEPRIELLLLELDDSALYQGLVSLRLDYQLRGTNSRYNLVYPFYLNDANELGDQSR